MRAISGLARIGFEEFRSKRKKVGAHSRASRACRRRRAEDCPPYRRVFVTLSTSYGTGRQPARFARACCKAPQRAASAIRAPEFVVLSKNPASRAGREGTRPFHARAQPLSRRAPAIPPHRQFEYRVCDSFLSRANSIRASRRGKVSRLCTVRLRPRLQAGPTKHA